MRSRLNVCASSTMGSMAPPIHIAHHLQQHSVPEHTSLWRAANQDSALQFAPVNSEPLQKILCVETVSLCSLDCPGTDYVGQAGVELRDPLAIPAECWDYRCAVPHQASFLIQKEMISEICFKIVGVGKGLDKFIEVCFIILLSKRLFQNNFVAVVLFVSFVLVSLPTQAGTEPQVLITLSSWACHCLHKNENKNKQTNKTTTTKQKRKTTKIL